MALVLRCSYYIYIYIYISVCVPHVLGIWSVTPVPTYFFHYMLMGRKDNLFKPYTTAYSCLYLFNLFKLHTVASEFLLFGVIVIHSPLCTSYVVLSMESLFGSMLLHDNFSWIFWSFFKHSLLFFFQAFVDSGAQSTIISKSCAERCGYDIFHHV